MHGPMNIKKKGTNRSRNKPKIAETEMN